MIRGSLRLLWCASVVVLSACGARTSSFEDEAPLGGEGGTGGSAGPGGMSPGGAGTAGSLGGGGAAGFGASAGSTAFGGFGASAGSAGFGGFAASAGFLDFGGAAGFGAQSGAGGSFAGSAGSGGFLEQACVSLVSSSCAPCLCKTCAPSLLNCFSDLGCAVIFSCAAQTSCVGLDCLSADKCGTVINEYGGPFGTSASKVFALGTCTVTAQSNCGCN